MKKTTTTLNIVHYLDPQMVCFLDVSDRDQALSALVECATQAGKLKNPPAFYEALIERERVVTTGIGLGIAIPHAKLPWLEDFFIVIGILRKGVDWKALDKAPVRLIFMIGGPDDRQTDYLQILSSLTQVLKDEERRKKILIATDPKVVLKQFGGG